MAVHWGGRGFGHRSRLSKAASGGTPTPTTDDSIGYGQSNFLGHITQASSPPAATAGTQVWEAGAWATPVGNGVREYLNAMTAATGKPARMVYGGQSGVNISALQKGDASGLYTTLMARVVASGITPKRIIFHHGEGDANTAGPVGAAYQAAMNQLHGDIVADLGLTKATCPMIISSLATVTDVSFAQPDTSWQTIKNAQVSVNATYPNIYYSHSNMDATLTDGIHWNAPTYGRSGKRYARTANVLLGSASTYPYWFATAAARVTTTTTDVTVVHVMGSDFSPTSAITGFEVSGDNGSTWVSATGARTTATNIRLTHADVGTTERLVRYQYGKAPTVSAPVVDNSSLTSLLNFTTANLVAPGAAVLPNITYATSVNVASYVGNDQLVSGVSVPGGSASLMVIVGLTEGDPNGFSTTGLDIIAQPSGTLIGATLAEAHNPGGAPGISIYSAVLPSGTTSIDMKAKYSVETYGATRFAVGTVPVSQLTSTTKVGSGKQRVAAGTVGTATLATSAGGVVFAMSASLNLSGGNIPAFSGSQAVTARNTSIYGGSSRTVADGSGTAADAATTVMVTYPNAADLTIVAASWR